MTRICQVTSVHQRYDVRVFDKIARSVADNDMESYLLVMDKFRDEIKDGVHIESINYTAKNRIDRILKSPKLLYNKAIEIDADIYQLHDPELLPLGVKLKKAGKKVIFDSHEDYYNKILDKQWIPKPIRKVVRFFYGIKEKKALKRYDGVISVTPLIVDRLKQLNSNTIMVTNYPKKEKDLVRNPKNIICFAGGITAAYNHDKVIKAISKIDGIQYYLAGNVSKEYKDYLLSLDGADKVVFLGKISHDDVIKLYSNSLAGVVLYNYTSSLGGKVGTLGVLKLFEYIQCKVPMVATDFDIWKDVVEKNKIGICVNPTDEKQIYDALNKLVKDNDFNKMCSENCNLISDDYCWNSQEKVLIDFYKSIL